MIDKKSIIRSGQYLIGLGALFWVALQADWSTVADIVLAANPIVLVIIILLTLAEFGIRFSIWHLLLGRIERTSFRSAANIDLVIMFINHLLPSRLSGRAVAPMIIRYYTRLKWTEAIALSGVHTGIHAILYGVGAGIGIILLIRSLNTALLVVITISTLLYFAAGMMILLAGHRIDTVDRLIEWIRPHLVKIPSVGDHLVRIVDKAPDFTGETASMFREVTADLQLWGLYSIGWVCKTMVIPAVRVWILLVVFGVQFSDPLLLPFSIIAAYSVTLLPITPGGIGVAEATATVVFVALGIPEEIAGSVIILDRFFGVYLAALAGWLPVMNVDFTDLKQQKSN